MAEFLQLVFYFWASIACVLLVIFGWRHLLVIFGVPVLCVLPFTRFTFLDDVSEDLKKSFYVTVLVALFGACFLVCVVVMFRLIKRLYERFLLNSKKKT